MMVIHLGVKWWSAGALDSNRSAVESHILMKGRRTGFGPWSNLSVEILFYDKRYIASSLIPILFKQQIVHYRDYASGASTIIYSFTSYLLNKCVKGERALG